MDKKLKICCITGHRNIPQEKRDFVTIELTKKIVAAISDGYNWFISGFADGADLIFAEIVRDIKLSHNEIYLEAALPYVKKSTYTQELLHNYDCDGLKIISEKYHPGVFSLRNRYMVDNSDLVIAVYDGRTTGGTYTTIQYAWKCKKEIQTISI